MAGEEHRAAVRPALGPGGYGDLDDGETFVLVRRWMWRDLNLAGVTLLVFARVWSFCRKGAGEFYESKPRTARTPRRAGGPAGPRRARRPPAARAGARSLRPRRGAARRVRACGRPRGFRRAASTSACRRGGSRRSSRPRPGRRASPSTRACARRRGRRPRRRRAPRRSWPRPTAPPPPSCRT